MGISPGINFKLIDLSTYVAQVPSSTGFFCALTKRGRDNELIFLAGRSDLVGEWGSPNIDDYGKNFGQGLYEAYNFVGESGSMYFMRCMPADSAYSNLRVDLQMATGDSTSIICISYVDSLNTKTEIISNMETTGDYHPICMFYPIGRGLDYNNVSVRITQHSNPLAYGVYILDIYEKQTDGDEVIVESFEISFDPRAVDNSGDSIFVVDILETYSAVLRAEMNLASGNYAPGYDMAIKIFDNNIGVVTLTSTSGAAKVRDSKQDFSQWATVEGSGLAAYCITAIDSRGNQLTGWLGAAGGTDNEEINIWDSKDFTIATQNWIEDSTTIVNFDFVNEVTYIIKQNFGDVSIAFIDAEPAPLRKGSDGSLIDNSGNLDTTVAANILAQGYSDQLDDSVTDVENIYFNLVYDCGYPTSVKDAIVTLVQERKDCVAIIDNGDNSTGNLALTSKSQDHPYNTYFVSMYEPYNKIRDQFTGKDIWVSPLYHYSYLIPRNDQVSDWGGISAGFDNASIDTIKELRFNAKKGMRDQFYLKQINPIVKFSEGFVGFGQLTTQAKASAMQDLNIVRLVLYCKRALTLFTKYYVYKENDAITWGDVETKVSLFLNDVKDNRGLYGFELEVGATEYEKKRKKFHVNVKLDPTRITEQIDLNFFIV